MFERGVEGESGLSKFDAPLSDSLGPDSTLQMGIAAEVKKLGLAESDLQALLDQTAVYGVTLASLDEYTRTALGDAFERLKPAAIGYLAHELRVVVAETASRNAPVDHAHRQSLDRNELTRHSQHFVEQVDLDALEAAIAVGLCSPLSLTEPLHDDRFYEGVATQPGHVAAGLVVPRANLIGEALAGIQEKSSVILTGPSGVGKSALLWSIPHALPGVLWFRVNRLAIVDVPELLRLCRSHRVSESRPIGLLIDAAGTGQFDGWSLLREEAAATPGLFIISTARHEDLMSLGDISGSTTITVALDEDAAESIYNGLRDRQATDSPHWREAFEQAQGLTLEFTHMLTRGERLSAVITDQVRRRFSERRSVELDLLSLSATADRWSASLPVAKAAEACGVSLIELREPISRLADEHLLVERNGMITGVHQLRSIAISKAIHDQPPPTLEHAIGQLLTVLRPQEIRRFIPNALRDEPELGQLFHDAALNERNGAVELTAHLRGLRLFDFYERALRWKGIAERHGVLPANQPVAHLCAITGTALSGPFPEKFSQAVSEMIATPEPARGSALVAAIGAPRLANALTATDDLGVANELLFELERGEIDIAAECRSALSPTSPLSHAMRAATIEQVADIVATASSLNLSLAQAFIDAAGGEAVVAAKIKDANPWIIDFRVDDSADGPVAYARVLHVSDAIHGDPHDRVITLASLLLRCFPRTTHVDVKLVLPDGHEYKIGDYQLGATNLRREYDHSELEVAWNRERMQVSNTVLGATDTDRLAAALPLIDGVARVTAIVGNTFAAADGRYVDTDWLADQINSLDEQARMIRPRLNGRERALGVGGDKPSGSLIADPLSGLVTDLTGNVFPRLTKLDNPAALAAHLSDHVIAKSLHGAQQEPWYLLGYDTYPDGLESLEADLPNLLAVVATVAQDSSTNVLLARAARAGRHQGALGRAADTARSRERRRLQARNAELTRVGKDIGWRFHVYMPKDDRYQPVSERLIAVDVPSLIDWSEALAAVSVALQGVGLPGEKFILVPTRDGKPVETLTMSLTSSLFPIAALGRWATKLPQGYETPLTDAFDAAIASLQIVSGALALPRPQRSHSDVAKVMEDARQERDRSRQIVEASLRDATTEQIILLLDTLDEALAGEEGGKSPGGDIASQLLGVVTQRQLTPMTVALSPLCQSCVRHPGLRGLACRA